MYAETYWGLNIIGTLSWCISNHGILLRAAFHWVGPKWHSTERHFFWGCQSQRTIAPPRAQPQSNSATIFKYVLAFEFASSCAFLQNICGDLDGKLNFKAVWYFNPATIQGAWFNCNFRCDVFGQLPQCISGCASGKPEKRMKEGGGGVEKQNSPKQNGCTG